MPNEILLREPLSTPKHSDEYYAVEAKIAAAEAAKAEALTEQKDVQEKIAKLKQTIAERKKREETLEKHTATAQSIKETREALHKQMQEKAGATSTKNETPSTKETLQKEQTKGYTSYREQFLKGNMGQALSEIETLPEFQVLTDGQKMLVLQGLEDKTYAHVKHAGRAQYAEKLEQSGFIGKIVTGIRKNYLVAKYEKESAHETFADANFIKDTSSELSKVIKESTLDGYLGKDGKTVITAFSGGLENLSPYSKEIAERYDIAATALARIPYEWRTSEARPSEKAAYAKALKAFEDQKDAFLVELRAHAQKKGIDNPRALAAEYISGSETLLQTMNFLSAHPDASKKLRAIANDSTLLRGLKGVVAERATLTVLGGAGRALSGAFLGTGILAAPVIGYFRGRGRAKETLREQTRLAREGGKQREGTAIRMSSIDRKIDQLSGVVAQIDAAKDPAAQKELLGRLKTYTDFIDAKIDLGQVNFGADESTRFTKQATLMSMLHKAHTMLALSSDESALNIFKGIENEKDSLDATLRARLKSFGAQSAETAEKSRAAYIKKAAWKSALFGGLFATAGAVIADYGLKLGWSENHAAGTVKNIVPPKTRAEDITQVIQEKINSVGKIHASDSHIETPSSTAVSPETISVPKINLESTAAHVTVGKGEGAGQTLLNFRNSEAFKKLPPEQQNFFKGNIWKITERLKEFKQNANGTTSSVNVGEGSEFGVTKDGVIYLKDSHGGQTHTLGHFDNGKFVEGTPKLQYIHEAGNTPKIEVSKANNPLTQTEPQDYRAPQEANDSLTNLAEKPKVPKPTVGSDNSTETPPMSEMEALYKEVEKEYLESSEKNPASFTEALSKAMAKANAEYTDYLNHRFGTYSSLNVLTKSFTESNEWQGIRNAPAEHFLQLKPNEMNSYYSDFQSTIKELAKDDPLGPRDMNIENYLKYLYELKAKNEMTDPLLK